MANSLDTMKATSRSLFDAAMQKTKDGDEGAGDALFNYFESVKEQISADVSQIIASKDDDIMIARGARVQTSQEQKYFQKVIDALNTSNPKQAVANIDETIPETVIEAVFDNLMGEYPLLKHVDFMYTPANVKIILDASPRDKAQWGALCTEIEKEAEATLKTVEAGKYKLTAFIPVCQDMLQLGAKWLDRYVRTILQDYLSYGLEDGFVNGTGVNSPIGMIRDPDSPLDKTEGHAAKTAVELNSLSIADYGAILDLLRVDDNDKVRPIGKPFFAFNPLDAVKVYDARHLVGANGYVEATPFATDFVESISVPEGKAIVGISKAYFGTLAGDGRLEFSDEYRFLEDNRTYKIKLLGNGLPKDASSFVLCDIEDIKPFSWVVKQEAQEAPGA